MDTITSSELRKNLAASLDQVAENSSTLQVSGANRDPVYIISQQQYRSITKGSDNALFNLTRLQVLSMGLQDESVFDQAYLYAWLSGVYPFFHDGDDTVSPLAHMPFEKHFIVSSKVVDEVSSFLDDQWISRGKTVPTFYELEDHYESRQAARYKFDRISLLRVCRYLWLRGSFDDSFWGTLLTPMQHPSEARSITREFSLKDEFYC